MEQAPTVTFVLRLSVNEAGIVHGVLERVRTGGKERFHGLDELGSLITRVVQSETSQAVSPHSPSRAMEGGPR